MSEGPPGSEGGRERRREIGRERERVTDRQTEKKRQSLFYFLHQMDFLLKKLVQFVSKNV